MIKYTIMVQRLTSNRPKLFKTATWINTDFDWLFTLSVTSVHVNIYLKILE